MYMYVLLSHLTVTIFVLTEVQPAVLHLVPSSPVAGNRLPLPVSYHWLYIHQTWISDKSQGRSHGEHWSEPEVY